MQLDAFVTKWGASGAAERANKDAFLIDLCAVLGVPSPNPVTGDREKDLYVFEKDAILVHEGRRSTVGKIDLYHHGRFILEAKQGSDSGSKKHGTAKRNTPAWHVAMKDAYGQALQYARTLDAPPPFLITADIGYALELYAVFDGSLDYRPFPDAQSNRLFLSELGKHLDVLRKVWTDPHSLDSAKVSARVTREVAGRLAELAKSLESAGHAPDAVATFLMRSIFTMFAEDVGLLPERLLTEAIEKHWILNPAAFPGGVESLWRAMNEGSHFGFVGKLLKFNGGLFAQPDSLPLTKTQLQLLLEAAKCSWADVEPAIFGTLLERALDPRERHRLGAHFTPRTYVERLVKPTIEEPLRADWDLVRAEVRRLVGTTDDDGPKPKKSDAAKKVEAAKKLVRAFHKKLCEIRVLDPACGSGNFLYVTLDLFKRLESEVLGLLGDLGDKQTLLDVHGISVNPAQFHGLEIKRWAKEIADLVLWIGYLQWHFRTRGKVAPPEPVLRNYKNIECRDAVLAYDGEPEIVRDEKTGKPITRWDGETMKKSPVTGEDVPDESALAVIYRYRKPRMAPWPAADFIISNPPYLGEKRQREIFGDGYVEALRATYSDLSDSLDYVAYWWHRSADLVQTGAVRQAGLITTTSMLQLKNRALMEQWAEKGVRVAWAVADHVWCDARQNAEVRVAMMVLAHNPPLARLVEVAYTRYVQGDVPVVGERIAARMNSDLTMSADVATAARRSLLAMRELSHQGYKRGGAGFLCTREEAEALVRADPSTRAVLRPYRNGQDIAGRARGLMLIDFALMDEQEAQRYPAAYARVHDRVRPERALNARAIYAKYWWRFLEPRPGFRAALSGLRRYIVTLEVGKHRFFTFLEREVAPDGTLVCIALEDAFALGVLSSRVHARWSLAAGGWLEDKARYNKSLCFDAFPFPACDEHLQSRIRDLGDRLDAHRKRQQQLHPKLGLTEMYNVVEKLRSGGQLSDKEKAVHEQGIVAVLKKIHDDLDAAVLAAYGWPVDLSDDQVLERLVVLNAKRTEEERSGHIRWLRPEFQAAGADDSQTVIASDAGPNVEAEVVVTPAAVTPWPKKMSEQIAVVRGLVSNTAKPWTVEAVARTFKGAKRDDVQEVLESLAALGLLVTYDDADGRRWMGAS